VNLLVWHVHGSWMTAFVQGPHTYYTPVVPARDGDGLGRARTWTWPASVVEVTPAEIGDLDIDAVVLQRPRDLELAEQWLGPGRRGLPTVYVEHDTPLSLPAPRHPMADRNDIVLAHVTQFNALMWESGSTPTAVIEHGVIDPGPLYTGDLPTAAVVINEPGRRSWVAGTDLMLEMRNEVRIDLFGMKSEEFEGLDLPQHELHREMARRRIYLHLFRWTSLGLTLIEAMMLGMPVVVLATTESALLPTDIGGVGLSPDDLQRRARELIDTPDVAAAAGRRAREFALSRFGVARFVDDWNRLLEQVTAASGSFADYTRGTRETSAL
jgi:hypothetical protein